MVNREGGPIVSVVIPVYNVQNYLTECVESVLNQSYPYIEIVLVDDGSTDESGKICDMYAEKKDFIRVIHKINGGLSEARNIGISVAKGDYITLLDSDDWFVSKELLNIMVSSCIKYNADIVICNTKVGRNSKDCICERQQSERVLVMDRIEGMEHLFYTDIFKFCAWGKLYRAELFENVTYPLGKCYEDLVTTYKLFNKASTTVYLADVFYGYRIRQGSIMDKPVKLYLYEMSQSVIEDIKKICPEVLDAAISLHCKQVFCVLVQNFENLDNKLKKVYIKELRQYMKCVLCNERVSLVFRIKCFLAVLLPGVISKLRKKYAKER